MPAVLPVFPKVKAVLLTKDQVESKVCAELKLVEAGSRVTAPEVLTTNPAVWDEVPNLSPFISTLELEF
jgi:TfoX/Sxy family transcriptional regulator of competence genes